MSFYDEARKRGEAAIFAFHGVKNPAMLPKLKGLAGRCPIPAECGFISENMLIDGIESVKSILDRLREEDIKIKCVPMLLQKGHYYDLLTAMVKDTEIVDIFDDEVYRSLLKSHKGFTIAMIHPSKDNTVFNRLQSLNSDNDLHLCRSIEDVKKLELPKDVTICALYMLMGSHTENHIFGEKDSVYRYLRDRGCRVQVDKDVIIDKIGSCVNMEHQSF